MTRIGQLLTMFRSLFGGFRCYDLTGSNAVHVTLALRRRSHGTRFGY